VTVTNSGSLCGYYGKVPAKADFVGGRLRRETIERWDLWLQEALAESQRRIGDTWRDFFFAAPIWRFILPAGVFGRSNLMGILMPSVDSVGRCFPLMLAHEIEGPIDPLGLMAGSGRWFAAAEELALAALGDEFELDHFGRVLPSWREMAGSVDRMETDRLTLNWAASSDAGRNVGVWMALPLVSAAAAMATVVLASWSGNVRKWPGIWWTAGAQSSVGQLPAAAQNAEPSSGLVPGLAISRGLMPPGGFAALLDGRWSAHGWTVDPSAAGRAEQGEPSFAEPRIDEEDWERPT
jgi:type VI secretion system protein ImpM